MFEGLKLRGKFGELSRRLKISGETHAILWMGIDRYVVEMKQRKLDPLQGVVLMLSDAIVRAEANGSLAKIKNEHPQVYADLRSLWLFCGEMVRDDYDRFARVLMVPTAHDGSPFDAAGQ